MKAFCSALGPKDILWISAGQNWMRFICFVRLVPGIKERERSWGAERPCEVRGEELGRLRAIGSAWPGHRDGTAVQMARS